MKKIAQIVVLVGGVIMGVGCNNSYAPNKTMKLERVEHEINLEGTPIVKEPEKLKLVAGKRDSLSVEYSEMPVLKEFEDKTNVYIEWETIEPEDISDRINLMISSNALPDAFYGSILSDEQVIKFSQTGSIIPLSQLIQDYAPNLNKFMKARPDYVKNIAASDGEIYSIAALIEEERTVSMQNIFINKKWLDALNLSVPTTNEELYQVLKAFKCGDPNKNNKNDEIPFSISEKFISIHSMFGMFGLVDRPSHLSIREGQVIYTAIQPEYKEAIKYFNQLYVEGLIDSEMFVQDFSRLKAKAEQEENILGMTILFWPDDIIPKERQDEYIQLLPLEGPNGERILSRNTTAPGLSKNAFTITKQCKIPKVAIRWIDEWTKEENTLNALNGIKDDTWGYTEEGEWETYSEMKIPEGMTYDQYRNTQTPGARSFYFIPQELAARRKLDPLNQAQHDRYLAYKPYLEPEENILPPLYLLAEEQDEILAIKQDLSNYVEQKRAKWITEGGIDDEWDEYIQQVEKLNVRRMLELYQNTLEVSKK